jgi:SAM-dependent methyltransferase
MTSGELALHYENYGRSEGRAANGLRDRNDFASLVPKDAIALEIGPFTNPILTGASVSYFDVLPQEGLIARANLMGLDPSRIPPIDYVSPTGELSGIDRRFEVVISSHCLEHQPDLINHLHGVGQILLPGGAYFLLIPDKRYCFDHYIPISNLAEVIVAHHDERRAHALRSVIEHRVLITHNESPRHWEGDHGAQFENCERRLHAALEEFEGAGGNYIDVHAWYFTPESAFAILSTLRKIGLSPFEVHTIYPTRRGACEFWMILKASSSSMRPVF